MRERTGGFGRIDHGDGDAVLDAATGIEELQLAEDLGTGSLGDAAESDQWSSTDQLSDVICDSHRHASLARLPSSASYT